MKLVLCYAQHGQPDFVDTTAFYQNWPILTWNSLSLQRNNRANHAFGRNIHRNNQWFGIGGANTSQWQWIATEFSTLNRLDTPGTVQNPFACAQLPNLLDFFFLTEHLFFSRSARHNFFFPSATLRSERIHIVQYQYRQQVGRVDLFFPLAIERQRIEYFYQMV